MLAAPSITFTLGARAAPPLEGPSPVSISANGGGQVGAALASKAPPLPSPFAEVLTGRGPEGAFRGGDPHAAGGSQSTIAVHDAGDELSAAAPERPARLSEQCGGAGRRRGRARRR
jgi:hypothetical protein